MSLQDLDRRLEGVLAHRRGRPALRLLGSLQELAGGWASTVYACHLTSADQDPGRSRKAVLKVYTTDDAGSRHALREQRALDFLAGTACQVPAVIDVEPDPEVLGAPFLLMDHIAGSPFWAVYEATNDERARAELVEAFVRPLVALHALDPNRLDPAADRMRGYGAVDAELAGVRRDVAALPDTGLGQVVGWLQQHRDDVPCRRPVILHRDYHPWNAISGGDDAVWVLDWDWQVGDARFDLAWTCTLMQRSGLDTFATAVRQAYVRQADAAVEHLAYFEVLTTVRWVLNVLPALCTDSKLDVGKREDFRAFLVEPLSRAAVLLRDRTGLQVLLST